MRAAPLSALVHCPVAHPVDLGLDQAIAHGREPTLRIRHRGLRPPAEVLEGRRAVPGDVAQHELAERRVAIGVRVAGGGGPVVEQHERLLGSVRGAPAQQSVVGESPDDVPAALALRGDAVGLEQGEELVA
jgi:hypothetical protein